MTRPTLAPRVPAFRRVAVLLCFLLFSPLSLHCSLSPLAVPPDLTGRKCLIDHDCLGLVCCREQKTDAKGTCYPAATPRPCLSAQHPGCTWEESTQRYICNGICRAGNQTCQSGVWGACQDAIVPENKDCKDGKDNDCDGQIDNPKERCDNVDNDCDGYVDNTVNTGQPLQRDCYTGPANTRDIGTCQDGQQTCTAGKWGLCQQEKRPQPEDCNGQDDDCDGQTDEPDTGKQALERACYSGTQGCRRLANGAYQCAGECRAGTQICQRGRWSACQGERLPQTDTCNEKDDNCDGNIDESCECLPGSPPRPCFPGDAAGCKKEGDAYTCRPGCKSGVQRCAADNFWGRCEEYVASKPEDCNGKDDDCNGLIDDNLPPQPTCPYPDDPATENKGDCKTGTPKCVNHKWQTCAELVVTPGVEACDGRDNDCDGAIDEDCPCPTSCTTDSDCQRAACGIRSMCHKGVCWCTKDKDADPQGGKASEICDGKDTNCDGKIDEESCYTGPPGTQGIGVCKAGTRRCVNRVMGACSDVTPTTDSCNQTQDLNCDGVAPGNKETCNNKDDDCDGRIDNISRPCYTGATGCTRQADGTYTCAGTCRTGREICQGGVWSACQDPVLPQTENDPLPPTPTCDGKDNDCDGVVDEGCPCPASCTADTDCNAGRCGTKTECREGRCVVPQACPATCSTGDDCTWRECAGRSECRNGVCQCPVGRTFCAAGCLDLNNDPNHCGACNRACPAGGTCSKGICECPRGSAVCNGVCTPLLDNPKHCGRCHNQCSAGINCTDGRCGCPRGETRCGDQCVNTSTNLSHCGMCGLYCRRGTCAGTCRCSGKDVLCATGCTDIQNDPNHCGRCGLTCKSGEICMSGRCTAASCPNGTCERGENCANCPADCQCKTGNLCMSAACTPSVLCGNGTCDITRQEDCLSCPADCACPSGQRCQSGTCTSCGNGTCEANVSENCSSCPADCACPSGQRCQNGSCIAGCGNGTCQADIGENCSTCPADCACPSGQSCSRASGTCTTIKGCGNGTCETNIGENCISCPLDCQCPSGQNCPGGSCVANSGCGNGTCDSSTGENCMTCPLDCPCPSGHSCLIGGNGRCNPGCGDGTCNSPESCASCPADCACPSGQVCQNNTCTGVTCRSDADCKSGERCVNNKCTASGCGNGTCDSGENCTKCAADCRCSSGQICLSGKCVASGCGNGTCDSGENCASCAVDCRCSSGQLCLSGKCVATNVCGNGFCETSAGESCSSCAADCKCPSGQVCQNGTCSTPCGNGTCEPARGENCSSCPGDCACPTGQACLNQQCTVLAACGNNTCEAARGETCSTCPRDCACPTGQTCQNGTCSTAGSLYSICSGGQTCNSGLICVGAGAGTTSYCLATCSGATGTCKSAGFFCAPLSGRGGACIEKCQQPCNQDSDCSQGQTCTNKVCTGTFCTNYGTCTSISGLSHKVCI